MQVSLEDLVANIGDGARVAVPPTRSGAAVAATRALIDSGVRDLHIVAVPTSGLQVDMLIGAGCVATVESAGITLDEQGQAPRFVSAVRNGEIRLMDSTCPALISAVQAGEKGIPFIPMRGLLGSDLLRHRPDYRVIDNPMADPSAETADPIVLLPAIVPDVALFHAPLADRDGNVWIGKPRELMTLAHAARKTLVTVEAFTDDNLMADPLRAPACIPSTYITAVAEVVDGAWPLPLPDVYPADTEALREYAGQAKSAEGFDSWLRGASNTAPALRASA